MAADGTIRIDTKIDPSGFNQGVTQAQKGLGNLTASIGKAGKALAGAFVAGQIAKIGKEALETAAEVRAANSQMSQTFGALEADARAAMERVGAQGGIMVSRLQSVGTGIFAFARTTGMDSAAALAMMERALQVTADSAAYYDRTLEETAESLQSFLKGNYENDAALGLSCTETTRNAAANRLYGKSFNDLSEAQKQLTLLQMVEDANALSGAMGQAAREADGWANVTGNCQEALRLLMAAVADPALEAAVPAVQAVTGWLQTLTSTVQSGYAAIRAWMDTVDFGPLLASAQHFGESLREMLDDIGGGVDKLAKALEPFARWVIEQALPLILDGLSALSDGVGKVFNWIATQISNLIGWVGDLIDRIKDAVAWLFRLFDQEPPAWTNTASEDGQPEAGSAPDTSTDTGALPGIGEAEADTGADTSGGGSTGGGGGGSGGGSGSGRENELLSFDDITRLSASSGGSGGGSGSSGSGNPAQTGQQVAQGGASAAQGVQQAADASNRLTEAAGEVDDAIGALSLSIELLTETAHTARDALDNLLRPRRVRVTLDAQESARYRAALERWEALEDKTRTATLRLTLARSWDAVLAQWERLRDETIVKQLAADLRTAVILSVRAFSAEDGGEIVSLLQKIYTLLKTWYEHIYGRGGGFHGSPEDGGALSDGRGGGFGGGTGGGTGGGFGSSRDGVFGSIGSDLLDTVARWWDSLVGGRATKTLDLKGGRFSGGSGSASFAKGVEQWNALKDGKATKTLNGKKTGAFSTLLTQWNGWKSGVITKTANGVRTSGYNSVLSNWNSWRSGPVTKTANGVRTSGYHSARASWDGWRSGTVTKTANGTKSKTFNSVKRDWDSIQAGTVTRTLNLKTSVTSLKSFVNDKVISPINKAIHTVFPGISIPKLARGGVAMGPSMALIGEAGREAVLPLDRNTGWMDELAGRLAQAGGMGGGEIVVEIHVGNERLTRQVIRSINDETRRTGRCVLYV